MKSHNMSKLIPLVIFIVLIFLSVDAAAGRTGISSLRKLLQQSYGNPGVGYGDKPIGYGNPGGGYGNPGGGPGGYGNPEEYRTAPYPP